jgi:hypothetical protein
METSLSITSVDLRVARLRVDRSDRSTLDQTGETTGAAGRGERRALPTGAAQGRGGAAQVNSGPPAENAPEVEARLDAGATRLALPPGPGPGAPLQRAAALLHARLAGLQRAAAEPRPQQSVRV